jgi:hypothetical protein
MGAAHQPTLALRRARGDLDLEGVRADVQRKPGGIGGSAAGEQRERVEAAA